LEETSARIGSHLANTGLTLENLHTPHDLAYSRSLAERIGEAIRSGAIMTARPCPQIARLSREQQPGAPDRAGAYKQHRRRKPDFQRSRDHGDPPSNDVQQSRIKDRYRK
jgi:hypothetical protein